jgi:hypothetical protein
MLDLKKAARIIIYLDPGECAHEWIFNTVCRFQYTILLDDYFPREFEIPLLSILFTEVNRWTRLKLTEYLILEVRTVKPSVIRNALDVYMK